MANGRIAAPGDSLDASRAEQLIDGRIAVGDQADLILVEPDELTAFDPDASVYRAYREAFQHKQLGNRSDGVVPLVMIAGRPAWTGADFDPRAGREKLGTPLTLSARDRTDPQSRSS